MMNGKSGKKRLKFPISSLSTEEFDRKLREVGAEVFPFSLLLGTKKQWCVVSSCEDFLREVKAEIESKGLNKRKAPKVRRKDNEYYYFNDDVVVITKAK